MLNACLQKGDDHGENHPNVDPFDIGGRQDRLGDPNEAELLFLSHYHLKPISIVNLQRSKNKKYGEMYLDDHVGEVIRKHLSHKAAQILILNITCSSPLSAQSGFPLHLFLIQW